MKNAITFTEFNLAEPILKSLAELNYETPTPIQSQAIPYLLEGKDLLGCAQTGTGKTAAFALPILNKIYHKKHSLKPKQAETLILTPTRELAAQIYTNFKEYGSHMKFKVAVVYGGVSLGPQAKELQDGVDVLIATPGRLLDLISQRKVSIQFLKTFVLDEADRMLDMGFIHDIKRILYMIPSQRQTLFFSATMPNEIQKLASTMLKDPVKVEVVKESTTAENIAQKVFYVERSHKKDLLRHILKDPKADKVIVFTRTKHGANRVTELLQKNKISSLAIHGNKSQNARLKALEEFKKGEVRVLIATDIAARGIDVDHISHVINFEVPNIAESYVHRIGRTARAGRSGVAYSFCDIEEKSFIRDIEKITGQKIPVEHDHPYHSIEVEKADILSKGKAKAQLEKKENHGQGRRPRRGGSDQQKKSHFKKKRRFFGHGKK